MGARGLAEPATQALKGQRGWQPGGFLPGLKYAHTYKGELIAIPSGTNASALAINLELLDRVNLKLPPATWTWQTLTDYAVRLTVRTGGAGRRGPTGRRHLRPGPRRLAAQAQDRALHTCTLRHGRVATRG